MHIHQSNFQKFYGFTPLGCFFSLSTDPLEFQYNTMNLSLQYIEGNKNHLFP